MLTSQNTLHYMQYVRPVGPKTVPLPETTQNNVVISNLADPRIFVHVRFNTEIMICRKTRSGKEERACSYLDSVTLSRRHAIVGIDTKGTYVIDVGTDGQGSTNGTFINGWRLEPGRKYYLGATDELWMGSVDKAPGHKVIVQFLP